MKKIIIIAFISFLALYSISSIAKAHEITTPTISKTTLNLVKGETGYYSPGLSGGYAATSNIKVCQY